MPYNLMREPWLPLRRRGGGVELVEPWRLTDRGPDGQDPFVAVDSPRPDFDGALTEFLIGLVQTAWPPPDERAWRRAWQEPPKPEVLRQACETVSHAFDLDGPGPRFMQEILPKRKKAHPVSMLLIDQPADNTIDLNHDFFEKRGRKDALCRSCAAMAVFSLQTYAPSGGGGGGGKHTSIRGGGPLTTLPLGDDLWQTTWMAIQPVGRYWNKAVRASMESPRLYPWLFSPQPKIPDKVTLMTPEMADPGQCYWGMPRRIWLEFKASDENQGCQLCGRHDSSVVNEYFDCTMGIDYKGPWLHPLSPYRWKDGNPIAVHGSIGPLGFRHWLELTITPSMPGSKDDPGNIIVRRAKIVDIFKDRRLGFLEMAMDEPELKIWAFGYNMDQQKAKAWVDSRMPLVLVADDHRQDYELGVKALVGTAEKAADVLVNSLKKAWFPKKTKASTDKGDLERLGRLFWAESEADFYRAVGSLKALLEQGRDFWSLEDADCNACKEKWLKTLHERVLAIFDEYSQYQQVEKANPKRIVLARKNLWFWVGPWAKKMREALNLPALEKPAKKASRGKGEQA